MWESLFWGLFSASSLLLGAALALKIKFSQKAVGLIMAFGVGALISSVAFELIEKSFDLADGLLFVTIGLASGAFAYFFGNLALGYFGARNRKSTEKSDPGSGVAILLGTILDGIPESTVIGLSMAQGGIVSVAMVVAVFLSNLPEALSSSTGLAKSGWKKARIMLLWMGVVLVSGLSSLAGFVLFGESSPLVQALILSFAAGAILTMLSDSMMPEAYKSSGPLVGLVVTLGFITAFAVSTFE